MTKEIIDNDPYKSAGVDIQAGNELVNKIKEDVASSHGPNVIGNIGGFAGMFKLDKKYNNPILVACTDGVGTKVALAQQTKKLDAIGQDLVAMCVNDLIVQGAEPLFFLDYYATGKLDVDTAADVVTGIGKGCEISGCALIGGETAEMPGMYDGEDYDMAGFCTGVVEKSKIIDGTKVAAGDQLIALASSGPHSNGFSLIRKVLEVSNADTNQVIDGKTLGEHLLEPTRIYVKPLLELFKQVDVHALSHITGGGFWENIPRVLPESAKAVVKGDSWQWPSVFSWLQENGNITTHEMYRTFNCGVGMVLVVPADQLENSLNILKDLGENAWHLGEIQDAVAGEEQVEIVGGAA